MAEMEQDPGVTPRRVRPRVADELRVLPVALHVMLLLGAAAIAVLEHGFYEHQQPMRPWLNHLLQTLLLAVYAVVALAPRWIGIRAPRHLHGDWFSRVMLALAFVGAATHLAGIARPAWGLFELALLLLLVSDLWRLNVTLSRRFFRPGILLPMSFATLILVGTPLLMVPRAVTEGHHISFLDALFTMTSAVCVTGLIVKDTATDFTPFGQAIIGVFIQLGGLGIMVFGSVMAMLLGARLSLREDLTLSQMLNDQPIQRISGYVRFVVLGTLVIELIGAAALMPMWDDPTGSMTLQRRAGLSLFHAVSAFCNAGFALQSDSLVQYRYSAYVHLVVMPLIVMGGLGFPVLENIAAAGRHRWRQWRLRRRGRAAVPPAGHVANLAAGRLSLHSKLVLTTTAALYLYGVVGIAVSQLRPHVVRPAQTAGQQAPPWHGGRTLAGTLADASFMSVTARTAGFNTMPMDEIEPTGRFVLITLMLVGASPGGTGGGMKTTTLAIIVLTVGATLRQRERTEAFGREIGDALVRRAATMAASLVVLATVATLLLTLSETGPYINLAFEAVSAATTTGLSLGTTTSSLTGFGKVVIIVTMFLGRVGPLTLLGALMFGLRAQRPYRLPRESVVMG